MKSLLSRSLLASLVLAAFVSACGDDDPTPGAGTLTVTYSGNAPTGGTAPRDTNTYRTGETVTILGPGTLVKTGFFFAGWTSTAGASYQPGDTFVMGTANVLLYASWSQSPTYTVSYSGNGNTSGAPPQDGESYAEGETVTVLGAGTMTKEGSTFAGWSDGTTTYQANATFTMGSANVTLSAVWTAVSTYHVTYNANGATSGSAPTDAGAYPAGATVTVLGQGALAKAGSTFGGWLLNATTYAGGATFTMPAQNVTLVAIWNVVPTYTVSFDDGDADSGAVPVPADYPEGFGLTLPGQGSLVRAGYDFAGWTDGTTSYAAGATYTVGTTDVTITAVWALETFSVSYVSTDHTSGTVPGDTNNYTDGATVTVATSDLARTGYRFEGWSRSGGGTFNAGETFAINGADVTLTATWVQVYVVTYVAPDADPGTVPAAASFAEGETVEISDTVPVRAGYVFTGWSDGTTTYQVNQSFSMPAAPVTLTAQWTPELTLSYNGNGNTAGTVPSSRTFTAGEMFTIASGASLAIADRCFAFWNTAQDRSGTIYLSNQPFVAGSADVTLYAQYNTTPQVEAATTEEVRITPVSITPSLEMVDVDFAISINAVAEFEATLTGDAGVAFDVAAIEAVFDPLASNIYTVAADTVTFRGTLAEVNQAIAALTVLPPTAGFGQGEMVVSVSDLGMVGECELIDSETISLEWLP